MVWLAMVRCCYTEGDLRLIVREDDLLSIPMRASYYSELLAIVAKVHGPVARDTQSTAKLFADRKQNLTSHSYVLYDRFERDFLDLMGEDLFKISTRQ